MEKKIAYTKVITSPEDSDSIVRRIREEFEGYGTIENISLSPREKENTYDAAFIIRINQNFGEFELYAYYQGWEKHKEFIIRG